MIVIKYKDARPPKSISFSAFHKTPKYAEEEHQTLSLLGVLFFEKVYIVLAACLLENASEEP